MLMSSLSVIAAVQQQKNQVDKIFFHQGNAQVPHIELANLALYFAQEPQIRYTETNKQNSKQFALLFPHTAIDKQSIAKITAKNNLGYHVQAHQDNQGVHLVIDYDPMRVAISYDTFRSIGLKHGVVIHFFNQTLLQQLNSMQKPVLYTTALDIDKKKVVIDVGHGGNDMGASCFGLKEKEVTLAVSTKLAQLLHEQGIEVYMTRTTDCTCALDERTTRANNNNADLFISIHANYAVNGLAEGIETFYFKPDLLQRKYTVLDGVSAQTAQCIIDRRYAQSKQLAHMVHNNLLQAVQQRVPVRDRLVKHAVSQVLLGTQMPAILVEVGFLSNEQEAKRLASQQYIMQLAYGMCKGVCAYLDA